MEIGTRIKVLLYRVSNEYLNNILALVQGLILLPLYLKYIDATLFGAWLATGNVVAYLSILDFGLSSIITQDIAFLYGQKDFKKLNESISVGIISSFLFGLICVILGIIIAPFIPYIVNLSNYNNELRYAFVISVISTGLMLFNYGISAIIYGMQKTLYCGLSLNISTIIGIISTVIFLMNGFGIIAIPLGLLVRSSFYFIAISCYATTILRSLDFFTKKSLNMKLFPKLLGKTSFTTISKAARMIASQSDGIIISNVLGPYYNTIYSINYKAASILVLFIVRISTSFMPILANLKGENTPAAIQKIIRILFRYTIILSIIILGAAAIFNKMFISFWVGEEYYAGQLLNIMLAFSFLFYTIYILFSDIIFGLGNIKKVTILNINEVFIKIPISILLCYWLNVTGLAVASILSFVIPMFVLLKQNNNKEFEIDNAIKKSISQSLPYLTFTLVVGVVINLYYPKTMMELIVMGIGYILLSGMFLFVLNKKQIYQDLSIIKRNNI